MDKNNFSESFTEAYKKLWELHPQQEEDIFKLRYLHVNWFFPHHLHNVLSNIKQFHSKYFPDANIQASLFAGLFHDAGLVYERDTASPIGHEERSAKYAQYILKDLGYDQQFIDTVISAIKATEPSITPISPEDFLVRNADAYAHVSSIHFFAKSKFSSNIISFVDWFSKKLDSSFTKITIPELKLQVSDLFEKYKKMIENYNSNTESKDSFVSNLLSEL